MVKDFSIQKNITLEDCTYRLYWNSLKPHDVTLSNANGHRCKVSFASLEAMVAEMRAEIENAV